MMQKGKCSFCGRAIDERKLVRFGVNTSISEADNHCPPCVKQLLSMKSHLHRELIKESKSK